MVVDGTPYEGKLSRTVWGGGKLGDYIKKLPIVKNAYSADIFAGVAYILRDDCGGYGGQAIRTSLKKPDLCA